MHKKVAPEYSTAAATINDTSRYEVYINSDNCGRRARFVIIAENSGCENRIRTCALDISLHSHSFLIRTLLPHKYSIYCVFSLSSCVFLEGKERRELAAEVLRKLLFVKNETCGPEPTSTPSFTFREVLQTLHAPNGCILAHLARKLRVEY